jgi:nucleoid DNA-binding protein
LRGEETKKSLIKGEEIRLRGYFSFKIAMTSLRIVMNLQTKKKMNVPSKRVPKCKFSAALKEVISKKQWTEISNPPSTKEKPS